MRKKDSSSGGVIREDTICQERLLDVSDVAAMLRCSPRTVRRLADVGRIPAPIRLGRLVRWNRQALQDWIAEGCPPRRTRR